MTEPTPADKLDETHVGRLIRIEDSEAHDGSAPVVTLLQVVRVSIPEGANVEDYDPVHVLSDVIDGSGASVTVVEVPTVRAT